MNWKRRERFDRVSAKLTTQRKRGRKPVEEGFSPVGFVRSRVSVDSAGRIDIRGEIEEAIAEERSNVI